MDHPILAQETKAIRHRLRHAMEKLDIPSAELLEARDVGADVGTLLGGVGDVSRATLSTVLRANFRRLLAESPRTLEEYAKLVRKPWDAFERCATRRTTRESFAMLVWTEARVAGRRASLRVI